jgi:hypothetical protein
VAFVAEAKSEPLFLDTSIRIAQVVHGRETKAKIAKQIARHERTVTGLVVRQEFKRRLLTEAEYLLRQLHRYKSFQEVQQHLIQLYGDWPSRKRKRNICLQTLSQVHGGSDEELTERLQLYLRSLLVLGLRRFDQQVDTLRTDSGCACARVEVVEKVELRKYVMGPKHCSRIKGAGCGIVQFLTGHAEAREKILQKLRSLPAAEKSKELQAAEKFLEFLGRRLQQAGDEDPCLSVGDLLIALESVGIPAFYTLNSVESQHLCRALGQTLIVRPIDPLKPDVVCNRGDLEWPTLGKKAPSSEEGAAE